MLCRALDENSIVLRVCVTIGFAAVCCRKSAVRNPCHRERIVLGRIARQIGKAAIDLVCCARRRCAVIRPRIVAELRVGQEHLLCLTISRIGRQGELRVRIHRSEISFPIVGSCRKRQSIRRIALNERHPAAGISAAAEIRHMINGDLVPVDLLAEAVLRNIQHRRIAK